MDPFTIATSVAKVTSTCLATGKAIYDLTSKYHDAPRNIVAISAEAAVISASMSQIQAIILSKQSPELLLRSRPEIAATLDTSLTGCLVLFSCLDEEIREISRHMREKDGLSWKGKMKTVWKQETFQELLDGIRGQQLAVNTLIQLLQMDSLFEITELLRQKAPELRQTAERVESIRRSHPSVKVTESIFNQEDRISIYPASAVAPSDLEFDFDDIVVNSIAYRRAMAAAKRSLPAPLSESLQIPEGDLIDFSESDTLCQAFVNKTAQDALVISEDLRGLHFSTNMNEPSVTSVSLKRISNDAWVPPDQANVSAGVANNQREQETFGDYPPVEPEMEEQKYHATLHPAGSIPASSGSYQNRRPTVSPKDISKIQHDRDSAGTPQGPHNRIDANKLGGVASSRPVGMVPNRRGRKVKFGDYVLGQTLTTGRCAKVKICSKNDSNIQVAVKLIRKNSLTRETNDTTVNVYRQVAILRGLHHPNIVQIHDFIETERHFGIILEYASGGTLQEHLLTHGHLTGPAARRLFVQLVSGIGYLHKKGIVHQGLRLDNLVLDRNKNIIVTGFGLADTIDLDADLDEKDSDPSGMIDKDTVKKLRENAHYSPYYSAPELIVTEYLPRLRKTDIWSCGMVLFAMLAGSLPFTTASLSIVHLFGKINDIEVLYRNVLSEPLTFPEWVEQPSRYLLRRMLISDPKKRADIFEVARHRWLDEYSHVVGFLRKTS